MKPEPLSKREQTLLLVLQQLIPLGIETIRYNGARPIDYLEFLKGRVGAPGVISEAADAFISGRADDSTTIECLRSTATAIALLAFEPGGILFFGIHYEAKF